MAGRFAERIGAVEVRKAIQLESIDDPLRNRLWTLIYYCLDETNELMEHSQQRALYRSIWLNYFEEPIDAIPHLTARADERLRTYFYRAEWWKPYDLLDFVLANLPQHQQAETYKVANQILEDYLAAYRFVGGELLPITDEVQIEAIEAALTTPLSGARAHLSKALTHLANRENPDAANSIKESISAVEALCGAIVGRKATLGEALKRLEDAGVVLHSALKDSWSKAYGYTSDADGIRHASQFESGATVDDAIYFLTSCSAFIGLLTAKAAAAGLSLNSS